ncbi:MAG TPA: NADH-quinone oxidoreductase subunit L [Anaeromyxobacteraceae bacterium]|nr:NADH-quinone oxidoreductase subunit L [Anaeromyxobacteraceae bacterium]
MAHSAAIPMAQPFLWALILLPAAGALVNGFFGRRLGKANVALIGVGVVAAAFVGAALAFAQVVYGNVLRAPGDVWFEAGALRISFGLLFDRLSGTLSLVVTGVGALIHLYSTSYMEHEDDFGYARFFTYLNLFVAAMMTLVLGDSLALTFMGWEGVGLASYLLIGFWYTDEQKAYCGRKAFVVNRIGDFGFLIGFFAILSLFGTADYGQLAEAARKLQGSTVLATGPFAGWTVTAALTLATLGFFVGCAGKSAQLPLYVWLPDAMAGPTPVSALIHAATMVTAGVYLVARTSFLFALAPASMAVVTTVGAATALFSALIAFAQTDIKKVLAYSTVSQLGFMFIGVGSGAWFAGVLHLVTHAFFKACLFLGAGSVMHGMRDDTDIRNMGGLGRKMPQTSRTFLVSTLAITGIVPLSGFFSKDAILAGALFAHNAMSERYPWVGPTAYLLGTLAAAGTAFYMMRLYALTFAGEPRTEAARHAHESSPVMWGPLWVLAVLAVVALVLGLPGSWAWGEIFGRFTHPVFAQAIEVAKVEEHAATFWPFAVAWLVAVVAGGLGWAMYAGSLRRVPARFAEALPSLHRFAVEKFRVDELYDWLLVKPLGRVARFLWRAGDAFLIDRVLVEGTARTAAAFSRIFRTLQNGDVQRYAAVMAVAAAAILWTLLRGGGP